MKLKQSVLGFVAGAVVASAVCVSVPFTMAASVLQDIRVLMGGISIYKDDVVQVPTNVSGDVVDAMIYDGTTYLPVRALVNMLKPGTDITWDADTYSIYLGEHEVGSTSTQLHLVEPYEVDGLGEYTGEDAQYTIMGETFSPFNKYYYGGYRLYKLDSNYKTISGKLVVPHDSLTTKKAGGFAFYSVDKYGEETLLKEVFTKQGDDPVDFSVKVAGCQYVKMERIYASEEDTNSAYTGSYAIVYNMTIES